MVSLGEEFLSVTSDTMVLVDGHKVSYRRPDQSSLDDFIQRETEEKTTQKAAREAAQAPCVNADGEQVELPANIGGVEDAPLGILNGAEGLAYSAQNFSIWIGNPCRESEQVKRIAEYFTITKGMPFVVPWILVGTKSSHILIYPVNPFLG